MILSIANSVNFRNANTQASAPEVNYQQEQQPQIQVQGQDLYERRMPVRHQPPRIGFFRLATGFLTQAQVDQINLSGKLPDNAKFIHNEYGKFVICNNFLGLRVGTQDLPYGFEVKRNIIGQALVLPKGSSGLLVD